MENSSPSATSQKSQTLFPPNAFNPWLTIAVLFSAIVILFAIFLAAMLFALASGTTTPVALARWFGGLRAVQVQMVAEVAVSAFVLAVLPHIARMPMRALGFRPLTLSDAGYVAGAALAMVIVTNGTASLMQTALHAKISEQAITIYLNMKTPLAKAQFALLGVAVAAIFEETIFRLLIFNAVRKWAGFWIGAIVSSLLFGLAHWQPGSPALQTFAELVVPLSLGGIVLCAAYAKTQNAYVPMLTHGIFNAVTLAVLFFAPQLAK